MHNLSNGTIVDESLNARLKTYLLETKSKIVFGRIGYLLDLYFRGCEVAGRSILEIGSGHGVYSVFCAGLGASRVVSIEPELEGATTGVAQQFSKMSAVIRLQDIVDYRVLTFDDFCGQYDGAPFDFILMKAVMNHINEEATEKLHLKAADDARASYVAEFRKMFDILNPGGMLITSDVGRLNFWDTIGRKSPFAPTIDWYKHQQPKVWKTLLEIAGFEFVDICWYPPYRLRRFGLNRLLGWHLPAYFMDSAFVLRARRPLEVS